ncbi:PIR protein [Plasmodium vivax]|uniref:VIR protein n=1 Tax=Plasmodium vivax TaxID=5855 RepID=A0A564ZZZ3_PLAVI|nr:PIR protein [Plasmodium vivax]
MRLNKEQPQVSNFYIPVLMYTGLNGSKFNNCSLKNFAIDKNNFDIKRTLYEFIENYEGIKNKISQENNSNFKEKFSNPEVLNLIYDKCNYEKTSCQNCSNGEDDVPCLREKGNSFLNLIFGNDADNIINILLKFTPFGKNLNKLKKERKKSGHKKKEENIQDYMKNYAAYLDSEMKNRVHLGYHPT